MYFSEDHSSYTGSGQVNSNASEFRSYCCGEQCFPRWLMRGLFRCSRSNTTQLPSMSPNTGIVTVISGAYEPHDGRKERPTAWNGI